MDRTFVIIVNYRQSALTEEAVSSLENGGGECLVTTVVVDNGSADGSLERLKKSCAGCTVLDAGGNLGFSGGNNVWAGGSYAIWHSNGYYPCDQPQSKQVMAVINSYKKLSQCKEITHKVQVMDSYPAVLINSADRWDNTSNFNTAWGRHGGTSLNVSYQDGHAGKLDKISSTARLGANQKAWYYYIDLVNMPAGF